MNKEEIQQVEEAGFKISKTDGIYKRDIYFSNGLINILVFKDSSWGYMVRVLKDGEYRDACIVKRLETFNELLNRLRNSPYEPLVEDDKEIIRTIMLTFAVKKPVFEL